MSVLEQRVRVAGESCRVWVKGDGEPLVFLAGFGGMPRWTPFLDRLAEQRRVVVPSLPGFPGGDCVHRRLDDTADWVAAVLDLLEGAGLPAGGHLVGASVGGMLAAEVAAFCPPLVGRLALLAPLGLYDAKLPIPNVFERVSAERPGLLCAKPERYAEHVAPGPGEDAMEAGVIDVRANEAAARLLWPLGDRGLAKRLHRITAPTLLLWGDADAVVPATYAARFAEGLGGESRHETIRGAGHLAYLDAPDETAAALLAFMA